MSNVCFIVGSGDFTTRDLVPDKNDFVIAADGGYKHLVEAQIMPDLLVGDFDSLDYVPQNIEIYRFPSEKDDTDMGLAVQKGISLGYSEFALYGGSGSRADHFYANLQLMNRFSEKGVKIKMVTPGCNIYALKDGEIELSRESGTVFSVFSPSDTCESVTIRNAKYVLDSASLSNRFPLGVSNEFTSEKCLISVKKGVLLIFEYLTKDYK